MRHVYECPLRWADMDMLGHVNNVTYVDYLQEARIDMLEAHAAIRGGEDLAEGVVVVRHEVEFVAPLTFRRKPVQIDCWVSRIRAASFSMEYEVYDETDSGRLVYLRATSLLAPYRFGDERPRRIQAAEREVLERYLEPTEPRSPLDLLGEAAGRHEFPVKVRWSDVDAYRHVNNVKYFEYFQEARIRYFMSLHGNPDEQWSDHVVARTDVVYRRPILFRAEPYVVHSWVSRLGTRSFSIAGEIRDPSTGSGGSGDEVLARAEVVMVAFDRETQRATEMTAEQRERLRAEVAHARPGSD